MPHSFTYNDQTIIKIGNLLPRLKFSVQPIDLIKWLQNFEKNEVDLAIDLLSVYEYIPFNEFMVRLDDLLKEILSGIPKDDNIIIFPFGKVGKSGTLVTYPLRKTITFDERKDNILLTHDFKHIDNPSKYNRIIFLDDFIGSGKTFCMEYSKNTQIKDWIEQNSIENIYILSTIIMTEGKKYIKNRFPYIDIFSEERNKIFNKEHSPLSIFKNTIQIEKTSLKYGQKLYKRNPLGYSNSQSLVSFFHGTPNNTLPIIWSGNRGWKSLFPRFPDIRMDKARAFKKEIAFYLGICNKIGIDLYSGMSIIKEKQDKLVRDIKYNTKLNHSIVALVFLKNMNYQDLIICHLLGITRQELFEINEEAQKIGLLDKSNSLTITGLHFFKKLKEVTKRENFRKETEYSLRVKNTLYIPNQFNGMT